jgi:hypothetical protein
LNEDNIRATFQHLYNERGDMFERGVENVFRKLSWDYKTNSPCRFGKRIVITGATSQPWKGERYGSINHGHFPNTLDDLLRVMLVLDGKPEPDHAGSAYHLLRSQDAKTHLEKRPREHGNGFDMVRVIDEPGLPAWPYRNNVALHDMVSLRGFKNGNCHLTFLRPDLVEKLNKIIARRFGNVLPPKED